MKISGDKPNENAVCRNRIAGKRPVIGYFAFDISDAAQDQWLGVVQASRDYNINLISFPGSYLLDTTHFSLTQSNILYDLVTAEHIDGIISWTSSLDYNSDDNQIERFFDRYKPIPIISIGRIIRNIPTLLMESYTGMYLVVQHMIEEHGFHKIAFIRGPARHKYAIERYQAYKDCLAKYNIPFKQDLVSIPDTWGADTGNRAVKYLLDDRNLQPGRDFEAIVAANDHLLLGVIELLESRHIHIPDDVAVSGFDDIVEGRINNPAFTTVAAPYYKTGYKAVEMILEIVQGRTAPLITDIPSELIIRQSCGCLCESVKKAAAEPVDNANVVFAAAIKKVRDQIPVKLQDTIKVSGSRLPVNQITLLLNAFVLSLERNSPELFLMEYNSVMKQYINDDFNMTKFQNIVSLIRGLILPCFGRNDYILLQQAENLWHQVRVSIGIIMQRIESRRHMQAESRVRIIRELRQRLNTTFNIGELLNILVEELPRLEITSCYLTIYEDPQSSRSVQPVPPWSRLLLAFDRNGRIDISPDGWRFPTKQLLPEKIMAGQEHINMVVMPLYTQDGQIGLALAGSSLNDGNVYNILRSEMSSTMRAALLLQETARGAVKLTRAYEEINNLNMQLKEENLQIRTEMNLARRIQTALLPQEIRNIHPDFQIAAAMLPTEAVGGDYYDIAFDRNGALWIGIGDVSGHGVTPGLIMMMTQTAHTTITSNFDANTTDIVNMINRVIYQNVIGRLNCTHYITFTTMKYLGNGRFEYAGLHISFIIYRKSTGTCELIDTTGMWLNIEPDISHYTASAEFTLNTGDILFLYTDGLIEVLNDAHKMFDTDHLMQLIRANADEDVETLKDTIIEKALNWCENKRDDDITLLVIRRGN